MKPFYEFIGEITDANDSFDMKKLESIYNIICQIDFDNTSSINIFNQIFQIFINNNNQGENIIIDKKQTVFITQIFSYINLILELENDIIDSYDIIIRINYYKYKKIDYNTFIELIHFNKLLSNNFHEELYKEFWYKFLDYNKEALIPRYLLYYTINNLSFVNTSILTEYIKTFNFNSFNIFKITDRITLFFLLILDKI